MTPPSHDSSDFKLHNKSRFKNFTMWFTRERTAWLFRLFAIITMIAFGWSLYLNWQNQHEIAQERVDRQQNVNFAVCALIDAVPPSLNSRIDAAREKFECGPYRKLVNPLVRPRPTPSGTPPDGAKTP